MSSGQSIYLQIVGTQGTYSLGVTYDGTNYIYTGSGSYTVAAPMTLGTTYRFTYYASSGNPWGSLYPSWTMAALGTSQIPLNLVYVNFFSTNSYNAVTGSFVTNPVLNGQLMRVTDYGNHASVTSVKIYAASSTYINQGSSVTLNTNGFSYIYLYIQPIGNFMQI